MKKLIIIVVLLAVRAFGQFSVSINPGERVVSMDKGDTICVKVPFDTEYSISLKNDDSYRRCLVNIIIDGQAVTDDGLILRTGETVDLERFISGNLQQGKRFKFVEKSTAEADGRRPRKQDGLLLVTVQYEQPGKRMIRYGSKAVFAPYQSWTFDSIPLHYLNNISLTTSTTNCSMDLSDGVTVEGSTSGQRFVEEKIGELQEPKETLVIRMMGYYKTPPILLNK
jgi:hypothetical protein